MSSATPAFASLWESPDWAVVGTLSGSAGYDSNLTLVHDGAGAYVISANPYLTLTRRNSETDFEVSGGVTETEFIDSSLPLETDMTFSTLYVYPSGDNVIPIYRFQASWTRGSQPDQYLGQRIRNEQIVIAGEGYMPLTGKLGIRANAELDYGTYDSNALNDTYHGQVFVGLAYTRHEGSELSLNAGTAVGRSIPNDPANVESNVRSREFYATGRVRGEITSKITGDAYAGFGVVEYSGGYNNRNALPVAGADLTWGIDPRRTVVLAAYSGATYAPNGQAVDTEHAFLSFTDVVISGWQFTVRTGPTHSKFSQQVVQRTDNSWDYVAEFAYLPSNRFKVALDVSYSQRNSDDITYQFDHRVITLGSTYRF
jgi:hypothetical protein